MNKAQFKSDLPNDHIGLDSETILKAINGDSFAQIDVGKAYFSAVNISENHEKAFYWLELSAMQRNMEAQYRLGDLYALGQGIEKNDELSYDFYLKSAIQGYSRALTRIHNLYHAEQSIYCRGQINSEEELWADDDYKKKNNIRELYEFRLEKQESTLTEIKRYFSNQLSVCKYKHEEDEQENSNKQHAHLVLGFLYQHGYGIKKIISRSIEFYTLAAEKGDVDAQYNLAYIYHHNTRIKWNYREAIKWYTKAAENGSTNAQKCLAFLYDNGIGVDTDHYQAISLYTQAAENHCIEAQIALARMSRKNQDYKKAIEWYKRAAIDGSIVARNCLALLPQVNGSLGDIASKDTEENFTKIYSKEGLCSKLHKDILNIPESEGLNQLKKIAQHAKFGDANAMFQIGTKYYNGTSFSRDTEVGFKWIFNAAKSGLTEAIFTIAKMYKDGEYVQQNYHKASIWYTRMAKKGNDKAQYELGLMYQHGLGVRKDPLEASKWYTIGAQRKKNSDCQYQLGILREKGLGLREDVEAAAKWFLRALKQHNLKAVNGLARMYYKGYGVEKNDPNALRLYTLLAEKGDVDAQIQLAKIFSYTESSNYNIKASFKYYKMAADQGHSKAKFKLATMYLDGKGIDQDFVQAYHLFKESSELGYPHAANLFKVPIDFSGNRDINYNNAIRMFELVCKTNIGDLEYNLAHLVEYGFVYQYANSSLSSSAYTRTGNPVLAKVWYDRAAAKSIPEAQYKLGLAYEKGIIPEKDLCKAVQYYKQASSKGNTDASYRLAYMYLEGYCVTQDFREAFRLFHGASTVGHKKACNVLMLSDNFFENKDHLKVKRMLETEALAGHVVSQYNLGVFHLTSSLVKKNIEKGIGWLEMASKNGYIEASYRLGLLYMEEVTVQNYQEAIKLFEIAACKDHDESLRILADIYQLGEGVSKNYLKAYRLYSIAANLGNISAKLATFVACKSAWDDEKKRLNKKKVSITPKYHSFLRMWEHVANQGDVELQYKLGTIYEAMEPVPALDQSIKWYSAAAEKNHSDAMYRLGQLYETGLGVPQNYDMALRHYERAGIQGKNKALLRLGKMHYTGKGVEPNLLKAFSYYKNAAKNGDDEAQLFLGILYEEGQLIPIDIIEAIKWYTASALQGNAKVQLYLNSFFGEIRTDDFFFHKQLHLLSNRIQLENTRYQSVDLLSGVAYYNLGHMHYNGYATRIDYEQAWTYFSEAAIKLGNDKALEFTTIQHKELDITRVDFFLKKLEMFEKVATKLKPEEKYNLGLIYYNGVYTNKDNKSNGVYTVVEPNHLKASHYFKMVINQKLQNTTFHHKTLNDETKQHYMDSSFYLGMIHYFDTRDKIPSLKSQEFLKNGAMAGHPVANCFLEAINKNEANKATVYQKILKWYEMNQHLDKNIFSHNIGLMYYKEYAVKNDYKKAFDNLKITADQGWSQSQHKIGYLYEKGYGVEQCPDKSKQWYMKASKQGYPRSHYRLAKTYFDARDYRRAFRHFQIAADKGDSDAQIELGRMYEYGINVEKDYNKAIEWYTKAADRNNINAYDRLGFMFFVERGIKRDYKKAISYYEISAGQGHKNSQAALGNIYMRGYIIERNETEAIKWYKKVADSDNIYAFIRLGDLYSDHYYELKDYKKAFEYYEKAAEKGKAKGQCRLAYMYHYGYGVKKNCEKAIELYKAAAKKSYDWAYTRLGDTYVEGLGVEKDYQKSFQYYKIAADRDDAYSKYQLGYHYLLGLGIKKDTIKGLKLMTDGANISQYSMIRFGEFYHSDNNGFQDFQKALECYKSVFDIKWKCHALRGIGLLYEHGDSERKDYSKALEYYHLATQRRIRGAYYNIALLYYHGYGVTRDFVIASEWFNKVTKDEPWDDTTYVFVEAEDEKIQNALENKMQKKYSIVSEAVIYGEGHYYLGLMCLKGQGTDIDLDKAMSHFQTALTHGIKKARKYIKANRNCCDMQ